MFCGSYNYNGQILYTPGFYNDTLQSSSGCDSIIVLNLTQNNTIGTDFQTACGSYTWIDGITYTASTNTPTYILPNSLGCDSVITLNLIINPTQFGTDFTVNQTLFIAPPFAAQFDNITPNASNFDFTWDFSDGTVLQSNNSSVFHDISTMDYMMSH